MKLNFLYLLEKELFSFFAVNCNFSYTLVVQLFNLRSRTPEAKLQAKLAEIGLLRARIPAFFETPNMIKCLVDRSDFATKERLLQILNVRVIYQFVLKKLVSQ